MDNIEKLLEMLFENFSLYCDDLMQFYDPFYALSTKIRQMGNELNSSLKSMPLQFLVDLCVKNQGLLEDQARLQNLLLMILDCMTDYDEGLLKEWEEPQKGYQKSIDEDYDEKNMDLGMQYVDTLLNTF